MFKLSNGKYVVKVEDSYESKSKSWFDDIPLDNAVSAELRNPTGKRIDRSLVITYIHNKETKVVAHRLIDGKWSDGIILYEGELITIDDKLIDYIQTKANMILKYFDTVSRRKEILNSPACTKSMEVEVVDDIIEISNKLNSEIQKLNGCTEMLYAVTGKLYMIEDGELKLVKEHCEHGV